ncbi:MAG: hypothetical protein IKC24_00030 [Oscillospiraceae bacterium]|nr:hypothetical protein [Oscillospiraceae bacterium]
MAEYIDRSEIKYEMWAVGPLCSPMMIVRKKTIESIPAADVYTEEDVRNAYTDGYSTGMEQGMKKVSVRGNWNIRCESHRDNYTGEVDEEFYLECSVCGRKVWDVSQDDVLAGRYGKIVADYPFCHCGAKMSAEEVPNG